MTEAPTEPSRRSLLAFFSAHPAVGLAGSAASIIGIPLAIVLFSLNLRGPDLVFTVSPARTIVVKQGTASRLGVTYDNQPIVHDVTAVQVAIWNRGREPIRRASVLRPVVIRTEPRVGILEATIRRTSREVAHLAIDAAKAKDGELRIGWDILERGDGGAVQIVYLGGVDVGIRVDGVVEGQPQPRNVGSRERVATWRRWSLAGMGGFWLMLAVLFVRGLPEMLRDTRTRGKRGWQALLGVALLIVLALGPAAFFLFEASQPPAPPFGF